MPIQRQSEAYGIFDDGPRFARDRRSADLPRGLAGLINTTGPRIQAGLLNTREAMDFGRGPRDHGGAGPDGGPAVPDWFYDDDDDVDPDLESLERHDPARFLPEHIVEGRRGSGRLPFDRAAARRFDPVRHPEGRRVALAPAADPAAMAPQMPVGGGFQPAHRVGLDWRDRTVPGTVIGVDGQVHVRWDDGQYTSEDPSEVRLL